MGRELNLLDLYPKSKRPIDDRGRLITAEHRAAARKFDVEYFDGDRLSGYGGYSYHPRFWTDNVRRFRDHYRLAPDARLLDVGCAKGFMLHDFKLLMPELRIAGVDVSGYALARAREEVRPFLQQASADALPFPDASFDLVVSYLTLIDIDDFRGGLTEMVRP